MKRKRREQKKQPAFMYVLPRDEDTMIVEAVAAGSVAALREYPEWKTRDVLETEARAGLVDLKVKTQEKQPLTNDLEAMCKLFVAYYISGFETAFRRYETDPAQLRENKALLAEQGYMHMYHRHYLIIADNADNLASIKEHQEKFFSDL